MAIQQPRNTPAPEIKVFDMRALWRLGFWGSSAAMALAAVVIVTQSDIGTQRLQVAIANIRDPALPARTAVAQVAPRNTDAENEARRLSETVRALAADRDRLQKRIAGLERNLEDMTGSIRVASAATRAATPTPAPAAAPPKTAQPAAASSTPNVPLLQTFPPAIVTASVETAWPSDEPSAPKEFGVDIGGASSIETLRANWLAVKARFGPLFVGMRPVVGVRERKSGQAELRLIVGPLPSNAAAAKLCATLSLAQSVCHPAAFEGQRLAAR
jgi:hypothetical protein